MARVSRRGWLVAAGALLAAAFRVAAQPAPGAPRIGFLGFNSDATGSGVLVAFRDAMRDLGWVDGRNLVIEVRYAGGDASRLPGLVDELLRLKVALIATASSAATRASRSATATLPIVMLASADAVGEGFVANLAHPGGNVTGMTLLAGPEIAGKQLELLRQVVPSAARVAVLVNPRNGSHAAFAAELASAARKLGAQLQPLRAASPDQIDGAFAAAAKERPAALLVLSDAMFFGERRRIVDRASSDALPAIYSQREFVDAGGLVSYGPNLVDMSRRGAGHVDKILRGARPADVPVEQAKLELVVNARTARALNLALPQSLLLRADQVIE